MSDPKKKFKFSSKSRDLLKFRLARYFSSVHRFLVISMLSILTLVMLLLALLNYWQIESQDKRLFDSQLINSAQVLQALMSLEIQQHDHHQLSELLRQSTEKTIAQLEKTRYDAAANLFEQYQDQVAFQVWDTQKNTLLLKSSNAPDWVLSKATHGFEYSTGLKGETWHSYSLPDPEKNTLIIIAMRDTFSSGINLAIFLHDFTILMIVYILIAISILWAIQYAMQPLKAITLALKERDPAGLHPIDIKLAPEEIRPLVKEINRLFSRVSETMRREKSFTADAAHELRTPLAALKTQVQVAIREKNDEQRQKILKNIIASGNRCAHVVEQLLTLSRLAPEARAAYKDPVILNEISEQLVAELAPLAIQKNIEIELHCPETPLSILGNKISMGILLRNLIANAIIYTPEGGNVNVLLSEQKDHIILQVIDTGPGIPPELHARVFDRFYRQLGNKAEGSGLGLSIVKEIVDHHHGQIEPRTPKSGIGLEMRVSFPKAPTKAMTDAMTKANEPVNLPTK